MDNFILASNQTRAPTTHPTPPFPRRFSGNIINILPFLSKWKMINKTLNKFCSSSIIQINNEVLVLDCINLTELEKELKIYKTCIFICLPFLVLLHLIYSNSKPEINNFVN